MDAFQNAGAIALTAGTVVEALRLVELDGLSSAVIDFGLKDGDADAIFGRLNERNIPFILHSGYEHASKACRGGTVVPKPAAPATLIDTVVKLLS